MKVLLIRYHDKSNINTRLPESLNKAQGVLPPLGIAYIAVILKGAGHDVKVIDALALNLTAGEVRQIISQEGAEVIGVTTMISNVKGALEVCRIGKDCGVTTVLGGPLLSIYPRETLAYDFVDYGIIGEGEYPMLELVNALRDSRPVVSIKGLAYKENGKIKINEAFINEDLDTLAFPDRDLLPIERYSSIIGLHPVTTMITSRGCPFHCGFCVKGPSDRKYRVRTPRNVVDEMELVVKKYKVKEIMFYDDTLTLNRDFVVGMCNEVLRRKLKIKWESPTRIDRVDEDLLKLMHKAGCIRLRYGVESGDEGILSLMNKEIDLAKVREVFKKTREVGIETFAYFIIGYIYETPQTIKKTISFAKELNPDLVMFTVATPYPKTPLFDLAVKEGFVEEDYWSKFISGVEQERITYFVADADKWVRRAYVGFYLRLSYILKRFSKIRSIDDIKKHFQAAKAIIAFK